MYSGADAGQSAAIHHPCGCELRASTCASFLNVHDVGMLAATHLLLSSLIL